MYKYELASIEEATLYQKLAEDWFKSDGIMFHDVASAAKAAVGEYIANQNGKTLYDFNKRKNG